MLGAVNSMEIECDLTTIIIYSSVQYFILINLIIKIYYIYCILKLIVFFSQIYSPVLMIKFVSM